ncbi:MAG TPA: pitrilysin family protein [Burkholderiales bacterium]|nr:pitrilysin family protein [Burkholderiales bacterium]
MRINTGRFLAAPLLFLALLVAAAAPLRAAAPAKVASVEGVTEYRLTNGLRLLTVPDPSVDTLTVQIVYLVGSRQEGYGEKGMAHLLEHMLFKGSKAHPDIKREFTARGARWNGTTSNDRTTYFETVSASDANLAWALELEADRMLNSRVSGEDLASEMTVVRNEFEMGENNPGSVLFERMQQLAFTWHNYGNPIIGNRADIERVPIEKLKAFYRTWYQPDNAVLIVGGSFDEARALALVEKYFAALPRPQRKLPTLYTQQPTQDGERSVTLRRVGDNQLVGALYRVPAGSDPSYPAIDVLVQVLGEVPAGRLHRALVQKGLAAATWGAERGLHDPGFAYFGAQLPRDGDIDAARQALLAVIEGVGRDRITEAELERARMRLLNDFERVERDSRQLVSALAEYAALGDWRLFYLYRDRLRQVTVEDVQRAAEHYLKPANRVVGVFMPTAQPDRAQIPPAPDVAAEVRDYKGGGSVALGERFDPSPQNIEKRLIRREVANGIELALLPKQTRGARVIARLGLHYGDERTLTNRDIACEFAGAMLSRGTKQRSRAQFKEALEKLNATVSIGAAGATIDVRRENLVPALRLVAEALREPAFAAGEFDELKRAALAGTEAERSDPSVRAEVRLERHLQSYPPGHPNYVPTVEERLQRIEATTLADAQACYTELFGATGAEFAAVGDFDADEVAHTVGELFGPWRSPHPFTRVPDRYFDRPAVENLLLTPDKANAVLRGGLNVAMRDDDSDFPALLLANYLLGGSSTARLPARIREQEGLSYSTYSGFTASHFDESASFRVSAIFAPQNRARVEQALREVLERAVGEGFRPDEVEAGKRALLEARRLQRAQDRALAARLSLYAYLGRTFAWDIALESKIASLTAEQVTAALRRHVDPAKLAVVVAGDFKK